MIKTMRPTQKFAYSSGNYGELKDVADHDKGCRPEDPSHKLVRQWESR